MAKISQLWTTVNGQRIHYLCAGECGPPVVLIHGGGSDHAGLSWQPILPELAKRCRVWALDLPGFGKSPLLQTDHLLPGYTDLLPKFFATVGLRRISLVGLSMGGAVALGCALKFPHWVEKLVLVSSYGLSSRIPGQTLYSILLRLPFLPHVSRWILWHCRPMVKAGLRNLIYHRRKITPALVEEVLQAIRQSGKALAWQAFLKQEIGIRTLRTCFIDRIGYLTVPTLLIHGRADRLIPLSDIQAAHRRIPNSRFIVLPDCGHWIPREQPQTLTDKIIDFIVG